MIIEKKNLYNGMTLLTATAYPSLFIVHDLIYLKLIQSYHIIHFQRGAEGKPANILNAIQAWAVKNNHQDVNDRRYYPSRVDIASIVERAKQKRRCV